jgi:hypothetical protein
MKVYRRGESGQPWRTPACHSRGEDSTPLTEVEAEVRARRRRAQATMPVEAPRMSIALKRKSRSTVS